MLMIQLLNGFKIILVRLKTFIPTSNPQHLTPCPNTHSNSLQPLPCFKTLRD